MASLIPCSSCRGHLRRHEAQCPFCGAQQPPSPAARRPIAIPLDASRATLFALGLTLVGQACGGRTEDDHAQNAGGAGAQGTGNSARGGAGGGAPGQTRETCADNPLLAGCGPGRTQGRCEANPLLPECSPVPPYGAMPRPLPETAGAAGSGDTSNPQWLDAGAEDAGGGEAAPDEDAGTGEVAPDEDAGN